MKNTIQLLGCLLTILCFHGPLAYSQLVPPVTATTYTNTGPFNSFTNTGNAIIEASNIELTLSCWDGSLSSFSWQGSSFGNSNSGVLPILGTNLGTVLNPDIAIHPTLNHRFFITYELNDRIYYEMWSWHPFIGCYNIIPPRAISLLGGSAKDPSIARDANNGLVVVWTRFANGLPIRIEGRYIETNGATLSPQIDISSCSGPGTNASPDVTTMGGFISVVYNHSDFGTNHQVVLQRLTANGMRAGSPLNCVSLGWYTVLDQWATNKFRIGKPSIAGPMLSKGYSFSRFDCHVIYRVVDVNNSNVQVYGITYNMANFGNNVFKKILLNTIDNQPADALWGCGDLRPVNTYTDCGIKVAWASNSSCYKGLKFNSREVVSKHLDFNGNPVFGNAMSLVNNVTQNNQHHTSLSGRLASKQAFYTFYDDNSSDIGSKQVACDSPKLRLASNANAAIEEESIPMALSVFPQPATDRASLKIEGLEEGTTVQSIQVVGVDGRVVLSFSHPNLSTDGQSSIFELNQQHFSELNSGFYLIRLALNQQVLTHPLVKQ